MNPYYDDEYEDDYDYDEDFGYNIDGFDEGYEVVKAKNGQLFMVHWQLIKYRWQDWGEADGHQWEYSLKDMTEEGRQRAVELGRGLKPGESVEFTLPDDDDDNEEDDYHYDDYNYDNEEDDSLYRGANVGRFREHSQAVYALLLHAFRRARLGYDVDKCVSYIISTRKAHPDLYRAFIQTIRANRIDRRR